MRGPHNLLRLLRIGATFERTGAMRVALEAMNVHRNVRFAARLLGFPFLPFGLRGDPGQPPVVRALTALGPVYIKFGQLLSTRPDIVGTEMANELRILQDKLSPFPTATAKGIIRTELGIDTDAVFSEFSDSVAAASIAQVHKARLRHDSEEVAVKVLRPGMGKAFRRDIDAFYLAASLVKLVAPGSRRLRPHAVIEHFEGIVMRELDFRMEAAAADEMADAMKGEDGIRIPQVRWDLSARRVLTLDWVDGTNFADIDQLQEEGHDLKGLARCLLQTFLRQALRDGHFHGDLHQGNLKVSPEGDLLLFDFGIMGRIDTFTRRVYAEILMGFIKRDYQRVARAHFEAGYVPSDQDIGAFAQALRSVGEPITGMDADRIAMSRLLGHLFEVTEQFGMVIRTELLLLQRTMVVVEGVARSLDPTINIWEVTRPVVADYIRLNSGIPALGQDLLEAGRILNRIGPRLPLVIENAARNLDSATGREKAQSSPSRTASFLLGALTAIVAMTVTILLLQP